MVANWYELSWGWGLGAGGLGCSPHGHLPGVQKWKLAGLVASTITYWLKQPRGQPRFKARRLCQA